MRVLKHTIYFGFFTGNESLKACPVFPGSIHQATLRQDYQNRFWGRSTHVQNNNSDCLKNLMIVWRDHPTRSPYAKITRIGFGADPRIYKTIIATVSNNLMIVQSSGVIVLEVLVVCHVNQLRDCHLWVGVSGEGRLCSFFLKKTN